MMVWGVCIHSATSRTAYNGHSGLHKVTEGKIQV